MTGWLINKINLFLTILEAGKSKIKVHVDLMSSESRFLIHKWLSSHCGVTWQRGKRALWHVFIRALISLMKVSSSCPNDFPRAPPPNTVTLEIRFQNINIEDTNIESIAISKEAGHLSNGSFVHYFQKY